jgi:hypothetical protein
VTRKYTSCPLFCEVFSDLVRDQPIHQLAQSGANLVWRVPALATLKNVEIHVQRREDHVGHVGRVVAAGDSTAASQPQAEANAA